MDNPFECLLCLLTFSDYSSLKNHIFEHQSTSKGISNDVVEKDHDHEQEINRSANNPTRMSTLPAERDLLENSNNQILHLNGVNNSSSDYLQLDNTCNGVLGNENHEEDQVSKMPLEMTTLCKTGLLIDSQISTTLDAPMLPLSNSFCNQASKPLHDELILARRKFLTNNSHITSKDTVIRETGLGNTEEKYHCNLFDSNAVELWTKSLFGMVLPYQSFENGSTLKQDEDIGDTETDCSITPMSPSKEQEETSTHLSGCEMSKENSHSDTKDSSDLEESNSNDSDALVERDSDDPITSLKNSRNKRSTLKIKILAQKRRREIWSSDSEELDDLEDSYSDEEGVIYKNDESVENNRGYPCKNCEKVCDTSSGLKRHSKIHVKGSLIGSCIKIDKAARTISVAKSRLENFNGNLAAHLRTHTEMNSRLKSNPLVGRSSDSISESKTIFSDNEIAINSSVTYECTDKSTNKDVTVQAVSSLFCHQCNKYFSSNSALKKHERVHTGDKPYQCFLCDKRFSQKGNLKAHLRIHIPNDPGYSCDQCDATFRTRFNLISHQTSVHSKELNFKCEQCLKPFALKKHLTKHMLTHTSKPLLYCLDCHKTFIFQSKFDRHQRIHKKQEKKNTNEEYKCEDCDKVCLTHLGLKQHIKYSHSASGPSKKCLICDISFPNYKTLKRHLYKHAGKIFCCEICNKSYQNQDSLRGHQRIAHDLGKTYNCDACGKKFLTPSALSRHSRIHNNDVLRYTCDVCTRSYKHKNNLTVHMKSHRADPREGMFSCTQCPLFFTRKRTLEHHCQVTHDLILEFKCDVCLQIFSANHLVKRHSKIHSDVKCTMLPGI